MWYYYLLTAIFSGLVSFGITYLVCRKLPQDKIKTLNQSIIEEEKWTLEQLKQDRINEENAIQATKQRSQQACDEADKEIRNKQNEIQLINSECEKLLLKKELVANSIKDLQEQAKESADKFYDAEMALANERLDRALEGAAAQYRQAEEGYKQHYISTVGELAQQFSIDMVKQKASFQELETKLIELRSTVEAAVAAAKRNEEMANAKDFYRLVLSESDLQEVACLRQVEPFLRDKEALNKVIWKVYYEKPYTDMIGRVLGGGIKTGIYKITNIQNGMCYVGQCVDAASRWRQHIKRGLGAETPTRNKLYPAMQTVGVENFTFELIEECQRNQLDEREDYWQDYFKAREFGYSIK